MSALPKDHVVKLRLWVPRFVGSNRPPFLYRPERPVLTQMRDHDIFDLDERIERV